MYNVNKVDWSMYKVCNEFEDGLGRELGIQSGFVRWYQFSASSYSFSKEPYKAILNSETSDVFFNNYIIIF